MKHIVLYTENPGPCDARVARQLFGAGTVLDPVLPFVSPPMDEATVEALLGRVPEELVAIIQPPEREIPCLKSEEVMQIIRQDSEWQLLLDAFGVNSPHLVQTRQCPRCWLVLVHAVPQGIPLGEGFVVDNYSRKVFPRRFADMLKSFYQDQ